MMKNIKKMITMSAFEDVKTSFIVSHIFFFFSL